MYERVFSNTHCMFVWGNKEDSTTIAKINGHFTHEKKRWFQIYTKDSTCNAGDLCSIPGLGRSPGDGKGYPLQYSGLENSMDCIVHEVAQSRTRLKRLSSSSSRHSGKESAYQWRRHKRQAFDPWIGKIPLEKEKATHSSILAWKIPWTEKPSGL